MNTKWYTIDIDEEVIIDYRINLEYTSLVVAGKKTVEYIIENYPKPYYIMLSGGLDSQTMLYFWYKYGTDFVPTTIRYNDSLNLHDIKYAIEFCKFLNLELNVVDFDVLDFYINHYHSLAERYKITSPHFGCHIAMTQKFDGTVVLSGDRLDYNGRAIWDENFCLYRYSNERSLIPYFFIETPEIAYSLKFPKNLYQHKDQQKIKANIYLEEGIPVIVPIKKYTGFELVKEHFDQNIYNVSSRDRLKYSNERSKRNFDLRFRFPYKYKFGIKNFKNLLNQDFLDLRSSISC